MFPMHALTVFLLLAVALVGAGIVAFVLRKAGCPCQFCDNARTMPFARLPVALREEIRGYFTNVERRQPQTPAVFVCLDCGTVFDDFSGEQRSRDRDVVWHHPARAFLACRAFCKGCNALMQGCEPDTTPTACARCGREHAWTVWGKSGLRYLMPLGDAPVLPRCRDTSFGKA